MAVSIVKAGEQARVLAARLNDSARDRVIVVVTSPSNASAPFIDVERVDSEVGDLADIYLMPTGDPSWEFSAAMAPGTQVYGGAGRVYPVGLGWIHDLAQSPLRFSFSAQDGIAATTRLIGDAFAAAARAGFGTGSRAGTSVEATATVQGTPTDSQAIVELHDGTYATVTSAALFPEIAAAQLFAKGMRIAGRHYPRDRRFELGDYVPPAEVRLAELQNDDVLPVLVSSVAVSDCVVQVLPNTSVTIPREQVTGNPLDDLSDLLSPGEIVLARVLRDGADPLGLSMLDVDESDDVRPALAVWPGGPGWLEWPPPLASSTDLDPDRLLVSAAAVTESAASTSSEPAAAPPIPADREPAAPAVTRRPSPLLFDPSRRVAADEAHEATVPAPAPSPAVRDLSLSLAAARSSSARQEARADAAEARIRPLTVELQRIEVEAAELRRQLDRKEKELADLKTRHRMTLNKERKGIEASAGAAFLDPEEDFRWEVLTSWVRRIPAGEKPSLPLPDYRLGPDFLVSLDEIHGVSRSKVADVVVEVLTGRAESNPSRELHPLRSGAGGDDLPVRRDGASCWRVSLQTNTPSARRLHFWRSADHIELSRVVLHDDFRP